MARTFAQQSKPRRFDHVRDIHNAETSRACSLLGFVVAVANAIRQHDKKISPHRAGSSFLNSLLANSGRDKPRAALRSCCA